MQGNDCDRDVTNIESQLDIWHPWREGENRVHDESQDGLVEVFKVSLCLRLVQVTANDGHLDKYLPDHNENLPDKAWIGGYDGYSEQVSSQQEESGLDKHDFTSIHVQFGIQFAVNLLKASRRRGNELILLFGDLFKVQPDFAEKEYWHDDRK